MNDLNDRINRLEAELAALKEEVAVPEISAPSSRRDLLRKVTIGAAGAALGAAAFARPAAAANGDFIKIGTDVSTPGSPTQNTGTTPTGVSFTGVDATGVAFLFEDGTTWTATSASTRYPAALGGFASDTGKARNGVYAYTQWPDHAGVVGYGSLSTPGTIGGRFEGNRAAISVLTSGPAATFATIPHKVGDIVSTDEGDLYYVVADGTPGPLRKLSGPTTAGQFHLLAAPVRVYDSRPGKAPVVGGDGLLTNSTRTVSLSSGFVGNTATPAVPAGATGALISLTIDSTVNGGFLAVFSNAVADVSSSNINWSTTGQTVAVTTVSAVDPTGKIKVKAGGGGSTQIIIDVIGYYR
ncbi:MAG: hypothetical protein JWN39_3996 [Ilumatobacteraceae bacterium]|nr:hypothetical protein [Ilumatobacteraceae bacterium]